MAVFNTDTKLLVTLNGTCFNQRIVLTHTYDCNEVTIPVAADYIDVMEEVLDMVQAGGGSDLVTTYLACLPVSYTLNNIRAQIIWPNRKAYVSRIATAFGTHAGAATVANDSAGLTLRTEDAGRSQVSTKHVGPIPDSVSTGGLLNGAYRTILATFGDQLLLPVVTTIGPIDFRPCIYNRDFPALSPRIVNHITSVQSRVQRRRTVGLGE